MTRTTDRLAFRVLALCFTVLLIGVWPAAPVGAEEWVVKLDAEASEVTFILDATGHQVHGSLALREGTIRFDPATGAAAGQLVADATSGETGNDRRDATMHEDVLESDSYPRIAFHAERVSGDLPPEAWKGDRIELEVHGAMELHGAEHPFTIPATVDREGSRFTATARFTIPYVEWGLRDPSFLFLRVAKEVQVRVEAAGTLRPTDDPGQAPEAGDS